MDEVGRGTTVKDGLALAFATVHHLVSANRCRTLFATHFHELADMLGHKEASHSGQGAFKEVGFFCNDVDETQVCTFCREERSHGLNIYRMDCLLILIVCVPV